MGGFIKRFRFSRLAIFQINSYLNYFSAVLLLEFVTARSAGLMRGAARPILVCSLGISGFVAHFQPTGPI